MSVIGSNILAGASGQGGGYNLTNSLRFRSSASAYLNRTPASAGNRKTWTWSAWIKRGNFGAQTIFNQGGISSNYTLARFDSSDRLDFQSYGASSYNFQKVSTAVYRDPAAWYHIIFVLDATNTQARIYVNGTEVAYTTNTNPANADQLFNQAALNRIGYTTDNVQPFDGYLAEVNFIDGLALTPSSFGETSATTGVWIPKKYTGTYGTNGFYLPFTDNSALTTSSNVGLGKDFSGNANYWTTNNISITSGSTYDSMTDVPTLTSATTANYCVLNPLVPVYANSISYANMRFSNSQASTWATANSTLGVSSGKWYWEATITTLGGAAIIGISNSDTIHGSTALGQLSNDYAYLWNGNKQGNAGSATSYGATYTTGNVIGVALDMDAGTLTFYKDNSSQGTAFTGLSNSSFVPAVSNFNSGVIDINFGQRPFSYTPPTGFVALNTFNLPEPSIKAGNKYMDATLYTGTNATLSVANTAGFQPDLVWLKTRSTSSRNTLFDSIRGITKVLWSDSTDAEGTANTGTGLTAFASNGFTLGTEIAGTSGSTNTSGATYVGWQWKAGGTGVTNTAGSITSTVSANPTAGFSVVTYTGNATNNATVGHGLGVAPAMIIIKDRVNAYNWTVYHKNLTSAEYVLLLNSTSAQLSSPQQFNSTAPTSSVFTLGWAGSDNNTNATTSHVAYCFAQIAGYSAFGSYTGNGSTDGPFVHLGFRPKFLMVKRTDTTAHWIIDDSTRNTSNIVDLELYPSLSNAESSDPSYDFLSNGFKLRVTSSNKNASGGNYIYMAFAENPFKNSLAR